VPGIPVELNEVAVAVTALHNTMHAQRTRVFFIRLLIETLLLINAAS